MQRSLLLSLILFGVSISLSAQSLFVPADISPGDLLGRQAALLQHLQDIPAYAESELVTVNLDALQQSSALIYVPSVGEIAMARTRTQANLREDVYSYTWYGSEQGSSASAILVVRNDDVTGTIRANGQLYFVRPLTDGLHAIARMDESGFVDHDAGFSDVEDASADFYETHDVNSMLEASEPGVLGGIVIYLIVAYTPIAASEVGDIDALILLAVAETNTSYANSNIEPRVALTHKFGLTQNESGSFSTDLSRLINTSDGWYDEIHPLRDAHGGDVGLMITRDYGGSCGLASSILAPNDALAFAAASQSCATGYYTFGHEIGHLQGARHNPEADGSTFPFAYGHGKYYQAGSWRTVMSYNCPGGCTRVTQFSNPDVNYQGQPTGDVSTRDNARVLDETAAYIADFRPDPIPVELISFEGFLDNQLVRLSWATSSETNNAGFEVQRAVADGWAVLGFVPGHGTTTEEHTYAFTDVGLSTPAGSAIYRLKQVDFDGAFEYSGQVEVALGVPDAFALAAAYPNPFNPSTTIGFSLPAAADVTIEVVDVLGRQIALLVQSSMDAGYHTATWQAGNTPSGTYIVRMTANGQSSFRHLTLLR